MNNTIGQGGGVSTAVGNSSKTEASPKERPVFKSRWDQMASWKKVLGSFVLGLVPLYMRLTGGFTKKLQVFDPSQNKHLDTGVTEAAFAQLSRESGDLEAKRKAPDQLAKLEKAAIRKTAMAVLTASGETNEQQLKRVTTHDLVIEARKLANPENNVNNVFQELKHKRDKINARPGAKFSRIIENYEKKREDYKGKIKEDNHGIGDGDDPDQWLDALKIKDFVAEINDLMKPENLETEEAKKLTSGKIEELCNKKPEVIVKMLAEGAAALKKAGMPSDQVPEFQEKIKNALALKSPITQFNVQSTRFNRKSEGQLINFGTVIQEAVQQNEGTKFGVDVKRPDGRQIQSQQERDIRNFVAELISPKSPADALKSQGVRIKELCIANVELILKIRAEPKLLNDAGIPVGVSNSFNAIFGAPSDSGPELPMITTFMAKVKINGISDDAFKKIGEDIDQKIRDYKIPSTDLLKGVDVGEEMGTFGVFIKRVFEDYFDGQAVVDKKAMLASFLRESRTDDTAEVQLVSVLKGAGPYMQKLLQLFGDRTKNQKLQDALGALKTGLSPIDPTTKRAFFAKMIEDSKGKEGKKEIESISDVRSLGAASVGEAFYAKLTMKGGVEKMVVVKLLRPGIQRRAAREREFFEKIAKEIKGMTGTFEGIANQIDDEMDLTREASHVRSANVYNQEKNPKTQKKSSKVKEEVPQVVQGEIPKIKEEVPHGQEVPQVVQAKGPKVQAMKLVDEIGVDKNYMVIERAPGSTVKAHIAYLKDERVDPSKRLASGLKLAKLLHDLGQKWIGKAFFESGFYHGDLHSGNMMFDPGPETDPDGLLTMIDFGNAKTLTQTQRAAIFKMVAAVIRNMPAFFVENFEKILSEKGRAELTPEMKQLLTEKVYEIMHSSKGNHGQKIADILSAANQLGIEIPATISNFSRSEVMLEEALKQVNEANKNNWEALNLIHDDLESELTVAKLVRFSSKENIIQSINKNAEIYQTYISLDRMFKDSKLSTLLDINFSNYATELQDAFEKTKDTPGGQALKNYLEHEEKIKKLEEKKASKPSDRPIDLTMEGAISTVLSQNMSHAFELTGAKDTIRIKMGTDSYRPSRAMAQKIKQVAQEVKPLNNASQRQQNNVNVVPENQSQTKMVNPSASANGRQVIKID